MTTSSDDSDVIILSDTNYDEPVQNATHISNFERNSYNQGAAFQSPQSGDKRSRRLIATVDISDDDSNRSLTPLAQRMENIRNRLVRKPLKDDGDVVDIVPESPTQNVTPVRKFNSAHERTSNALLDGNSPDLLDSPALPSPSQLVPWEVPRKWSFKHRKSPSSSPLRRSNSNSNVRMWPMQPQVDDGNDCGHVRTSSTESNNFPNPSTMIMSSMRDCDDLKLGADASITGRTHIQKGPTMVPPPMPQRSTSVGTRKPTFSSIKDMASRRPVVAPSLEMSSDEDDSYDDGYDSGIHQPPCHFSTQETVSVLDDDTEDESDWESFRSSLHPLQASRNGVLSQTLENENRFMVCEFSAPAPLSHSLSQAITRKEVDKQTRRESQKSKAEKLEAKRLARIERENKKIQKQKEKERKKEIDKVNRLTIDKDLIIQDMQLYIDMKLVDPSYSGDHDPAASTISEIDISDIETPKSSQILEMLSEKKIPYKLCTHPQRCSITWKMRKRAEWDAGREMFMPLDTPRLEALEEVMVVLKAGEFVEEISKGNIITFVSDMFSRMGSPAKIFVVVQGLNRYMQKQKSQASRQFTDQVRDMLKQRDKPDSSESEDEGDAFDPARNPTKSTGRGSRKKQPKRKTKPKSTSAAISEDQLQEALVELQVLYPNLYFLPPAASATELCRVIHQTTQDLALAPSIRHRRQQFSEKLLLSVDVAQVRSGIDSKDTWIKMLSQIPRVTPLVAKSIVKVYPTLKSLYDAWCSPSKNGGANLLSDIVVDRGQSAQFSKNIGAALSKRIYSVFFGTNPEETIGT